MVHRVNCSNNSKTVYLSEISNITGTETNKSQTKIIHCKQAASPYGTGITVIMYNTRCNGRVFCKYVYFCMTGIDITTGPNAPSVLEPCNRLNVTTCMPVGICVTFVDVSNTPRVLGLRKGTYYSATLITGMCCGRHPVT